MPGRHRISAFAAAASAAAFAACAGAAPAGATDAPDWVAKGSGIYGGDDAKVFYGVGLASNIKNRRLAVQVADELARAEIAKLLNSYGAALARSYAATREGNPAASDQMLQTMKTIAAVTQRDVVVIDHWKDPSDGTLFSLCKLEAGTVLKVLAQLPFLDEGARAYIAKNSDAVLADLTPDGAPAVPSNESDHTPPLVARTEEPSSVPSASVQTAQNAAGGNAAAIDEEKIQRMMEQALKNLAQAQAKTQESAPSAASDVDKPAYKKPEIPDDIAVVVGVERYPNLPAAQFAGRDAEAVRAHLLALGFPARNIALLTDQNATRAGLAKTLNAWLPNRVHEDSTVFFYYSGHGAPDPKSNQAYLVPVDGDPEDLEDTAYPIKQLYQKLNALKAKRVIVALDACFSGAGGRSVLAKDARPLVTRIDVGQADTGKVVAFSASRSDEISGAVEDQGHGAFTYYFLKGLSGGAQDASGSVTAKSLYDYLKPKVEDAARLHNRDQTPQLMPGGGDPQRILIP